MKLYLVLLVLALPLISCNETKNQEDNRVLFESSEFKSSLTRSLEKLDWKGKAGSGAHTGEGSRYISKYTKESETLYVYYEVNRDKTEAYNLHFIGDFTFRESNVDRTHTQILVEDLSVELKWLEEKVKFVDDIHAVKNGIQPEHQP